MEDGRKEERSSLTLGANTPKAVRISTAADTEKVYLNGYLVWEHGHLVEPPCVCGREPEDLSPLGWLPEQPPYCPWCGGKRQGAVRAERRKEAEACPRCKGRGFYTSPDHGHDMICLHGESR